ncbi:sodium channel protein Nach-like [Frieseomelitta varia]|uniref:sodium channel protein Nach-like n=1 Tax=Frieseomelitta varia TaxID=561572 RepID=UPI001CB68782|nr:sodium channel protein Nach-like [Frieseomelitta varia]
MVYTVTVSAMVYSIYCTYLEFMEKPLFTSVETEYFPTYQLYFPGVAICSINRISFRSATELANEIFAANITDLPADEILSMISQLGDLYDSEFTPQNRSNRIDQLLTVYHKGSYDIVDVMKRLTPQCSSMLLKCRFHDKEWNCSELFTFRKTQDGYCCTFNYATKGDDTHLDVKLESMKVEDLTENGGLLVVLDPFLDDYFYPIFPSAGWKVTIFNPHDYPDTTSGGVIDFLVSPRVHRSVQLEAIMFYSARRIMSHSLEKRDCVFEDELTGPQMFYTYSNCIVDCKALDMWKMCGCIPFFLPNRESKKVCNLADVPCLSQYKSKWLSVVPHGNLYDHDEEIEKTNTLYCKCYPECSDVKYNAKMAMFGLEHVSEILRDKEVKNQSVMTIYFNNYGTINLKQDVIYRWYELMGEASGICGIFVGFSLIVIVEFAYFVGLFVLELLKGPATSDRDGNSAAGKRTTPIQKIYWGELYSYARTTKNQRDRARGKY